MKSTFASLVYRQLFSLFLLSFPSGESASHGAERRDWRKGTFCRAT